MKHPLVSPLLITALAALVFMAMHYCTAEAVQEKSMIELPGCQQEKRYTDTYFEMRGQDHVLVAECGGKKPDEKQP